MSILTDSAAVADSAGRAPSRLRAVGIAVAVTVAAIAVTLVAGIAFLIPLVLLAVDVTSTLAFLALTAAGQVGFAVFGYVVARFRGMQIPISVPDAREVGFALGGAVLALVLVQVLSMALAALDLVPGSVIGEAGLADPTLFLGIGVLSVVLVAPAEEFLYRGVVQGTLREAFGPVGAITGASLLFGSIHLANYTGRIEAVVAGALLIAATGSVLGVLYEVTENLSVPIAAHAAYNVVLSLVAYATLSVSVLPSANRSVARFARNFFSERTEAVVVADGSPRR